MHFNNQTEEKKDTHELENEEVVVDKIEKETEDLDDQKQDSIPAEGKRQSDEEEQSLPEEETEKEEQAVESSEEESSESSELTDGQNLAETVSEERVESVESEEPESTRVSEEEEESIVAEPEAKQEEQDESSSQEPEALDEREPVDIKNKSTAKEQKEADEPKTPEEAALAKEMAQYEETFRDYKPGEIIEGTIVGFNDKEVLVDISYKSEGSIPIGDFSSTEDIKINSKIKVYINKVENSEGKVSLSKKIADFHLALGDLKEIYKQNETVEGIIRQRVKGGMIAEIKGLNAFLPGSQISIKPIPNLDQFIGKEVKFKIINIDENKKNIIVSRKKVLEVEQSEKIKKLREKIKIGAELDGEVKNITDYGAFIDLGGIDGLLHITDMSWGHISHPSDMLNIGDKLKVKVIAYEEEESRVSLGLKQLVPHPWENVEIKYEEGSKVTGKVVNITPYGAFVELEPGVEGLVHISEMSWTKKITNPRHILNVGDTINAIVLSVSKDEQKISLGMKQMEPNPWLVIDERYPVGTIIKGKVKSLTSFGAFVEIEEDIDGLIHISDISWTKRIYHPKEALKKGQEVEAIVLSVDKHLHRIALGMKQLTEDPWEELDQKLPINTEVSGIITKIIPKGVLVEIDVDGDPIEGFVPISHLAIPRLDRPEAAFNIGDEIPMKVIELDMENRRLILSIKAFFFSKEREELQEFLKKHEPEMRMQAKKAEKREQQEQENKGEAEQSEANATEVEDREEKEPEQDEVTEQEGTPSDDEEERADEPADEEDEKEPAIEPEKEKLAAEPAEEPEASMEEPETEINEVIKEPQEEQEEIIEEPEGEKNEFVEEPETTQQEEIEEPEEKDKN